MADAASVIDCVLTAALEPTVPSVEPDASPTAVVVSPDPLVELSVSTSVASEALISSVHVDELEAPVSTSVSGASVTVSTSDVVVSGAVVSVAVAVVAVGAVVTVVGAVVASASCTAATPWVAMAAAMRTAEKNFIVVEERGVLAGRCEDWSANVRMRNQGGHFSGEERRW
jgi:hypothetical protein